MNRQEMIVASSALRTAARCLFDDDDLDLSVRSDAWVDTDSYDAGLLAAAKYLLRTADQIEERASRGTR